MTISSKFTLAATLLISVVFLSACNEKETAAPQSDAITKADTADTATLQFDTVTKIDTLFAPGFKDRGMIFQFSFTYPSAYSDAEKLDTLQRRFIISSFGEKYANETPQTVLNSVSKDWIENEQKTVEDISEARFYGSELKITVLQTQDDLLQYSVYTNSYTGGAHGNYSSAYHILDLQSGKPVLYNNIFREDAKQTLTQKIIEQFLKTAGQPSLKEYGYDADFAPNDNIKIEANGLSFVYNPYQIGPYSIGEPEVLIPYELLLPYMKPESPLYKIAEKSLSS